MKSQEQATLRPRHRSAWPLIIPPSPYQTEHAGNEEHGFPVAITDGPGGEPDPGFGNSEKSQREAGSYGDWG